MDLTTVFDSYMAVFGTPVYAGIFLTLLFVGLLVKFGASIDIMLIIMVPFLFLIIIGTTGLLSKSVLVVVMILVGAIIAIALKKFVGR